jgi:DNA polymerase I-like protein with 3'-5' exonuclease and polymerase domains
MFALDTEVTGLDVRHGALPFFVTMCDDKGEITFYEWDVDPLTRRPKAPKQDLKELRDIINSVSKWSTFDEETAKHHRIVLQNGKFDITALSYLGITSLQGWPWGMTDDTLIAGHLLASNQPHDLTSMALQYLGRDISPLEDALEEAVQTARRLARSRYPKWAIAKKGRRDMPSAKEKTWKYDTWLPRALFMESEQVRRHNPTWEHVLRDYANEDSSCTMAIWIEQRQEIKRRQLDAIYRERMKVIPVACKIEDRGVTANRDHLALLQTEFSEESDRLESVCENVARTYGYKLTLPKASNNKSLTEFCFSKNLLNLPTVKWTDRGNPSLDKFSIDQYLATLPERSKQLLFIKSLADKRKRDTALSYMDSYVKFLIYIDEVWSRIHPQLNPTGTDTLRWSCNNPNTQQISKREGFNIRYCFGPMPGREWWSIDAQNIELRIPAYESGEPELIALFEKPNDPPFYGSVHLLNFSIVYPEIWAKELKEVGFDKVGPHCKKKYAATYYQWGKNGNFCKQYGGQRELTDRTFRRVGASDLLDSTFTKLSGLNQKYIAQANRLGYVETLPDKTVDPKRGYPLMCTRTENGRILVTVPLNYHVQSTAMWWTMKAMIRCQAQLDEWRKSTKFDGYMVMQVHDEIVFDFPRSESHPKGDYEKGAQFRTSNLWRVRELQRLMSEGGDDIGIPTPTGCEYHDDNWRDGVTMT